MASLHLLRPRETSIWNQPKLRSAFVGSNSGVDHGSSNKMCAPTQRNMLIKLDRKFELQTLWPFVFPVGVSLWDCKGTIGWTPHNEVLTSESLVVSH